MHVACSVTDVCSLQSFLLILRTKTIFDLDVMAVAGVVEVALDAKNDVEEEVEEANGTLEENAAFMDDDMFNDDPAPPPPHAQSRPEGKGTGKGKAAGKCDFLKCCICLVNPRAKKAVYCDTPCMADVKAAERDAARRSKHQAQKGSVYSHVLSLVSDKAFYLQMFRSQFYILFI